MGKDLVGVCGEITNTGKNMLTAYKIQPDNIRYRHKLGSVETKTGVYQHAFGISEKYITIF